MNILSERAYDDITDLAALICDTSTALVSLTDDGQQRIKSKHGIDAKDAFEVVHYCEETVAHPKELFLVSDFRMDNRFAESNMSIGGAPVCFYAGAALVNPKGDAVGSLCVIDEAPRDLSADQQNALWALSRQVVAQVELRTAVEKLEDNTQQLRNYQKQLEDYHQKLELTNARLRTLSVTDALTGLNNRFAFEEDLRHEVERANRTDSALSLLFLDADHFKFYNDELGHPAGDDALRIISKYLKESMRITDFIARIGGDEFVVILPGTPKESAEVLAERCRKSLQSAPWPSRQITASIGISSRDGRDIDSNTLVSEADQALYHAKASGRNLVSRATDLTEQDLKMSACFAPRALVPNPEPKA